MQVSQYYTPTNGGVRDDSTNETYNTCVSRQAICDKDRDVSVTETCGDKDNVKKNNMPNGNGVCSSERTVGTILAGPGENRRLIYFDVKAFFEDQPHIKSIGKDHNMSFRISGDAQIMRDILKAHGFVEMPCQTRYNNFSWLGNSISELCIDQLLCYQSINHFVGSTTLTRKDKLYKNISKMKIKAGAANFDFIPTSFVLPREMGKFKRYYEKHPGPFIVKPTGLSRGRGVYLIGKPKDIVNPSEDQVVSKYIQNPLLIDGYKVDLRIYVLVTSFDPLVIYIYQEGLTRFATVKYKKSHKNLHDLRMHLTNYSINVSSGNYIKNEDSTIEDFGSKWTLSALLRYLHANGVDTVALMQGIEDVIIKTILAAEKPIASGCRIYQRKPSNCFELFGFDIMLDDSYKPWLLEVNLSPSLVCTTPLDIKVKANMLCDLLNVVGLECYSKKKPKEGLNCIDVFCDYMHRTVGYFCVCIIRDEIRQLIYRHKKSKKFNKMMEPYKEQPGKSAEELHAIESKRAKHLCGMTSKDRGMVSRVRNEGTRCGGWVKIFPTVDSWSKYKEFMQYRTVKNVLLHQCLYPDK
ncbi:tubulin polyglutamylase TTLL5 [Elysia marginata]|uniref:Tubulin--tyrosine ligase-like protein 5 n=1 Tax=Elysia marginata TaxID=1093978 RepID=A0AAV4HLH6_9GAST|nr:tubulin polyglutamylase TTLL5 [Elysia marginata]